MFTEAVFFFGRTPSYSSLIEDEEILQHDLQWEITLSSFLLSRGGKDSRQEHNYQERGSKSKNSRSVNMSVYHGSSTVVTDLDLQSQGEKTKNKTKKPCCHRLKSSDKCGI